MSDSFQYTIVFDEKTNDVGRFTADIDTALNNVLSYNWSIKILMAKRKQSNQIVINLAATNLASFRLNNEINTLDGEISKLENERRVILSSVDQAISCLQTQRKSTDDLERQIEVGDHDLRMAVEKWDADIQYLQLKRDVLVNNLQEA